MKQVSGLSLIGAIYDGISLEVFVIPGLTRNPVFSWIPAFEGMTELNAINVAVYRWLISARVAFCILG